MSTNLNFRSALNGFNREDVVNYIEFLTNRHVSDLSQMKAQLDAANEEIERLKAQPAPEAATAETAAAPVEDTEALIQAKARIAELEAQVAALNAREPARPCPRTLRRNWKPIAGPSAPSVPPVSGPPSCATRPTPFWPMPRQRWRRQAPRWRRPWAASAPSSAPCRRPFSRARALCGMRLRNFTP